MMQFPLYLQTAANLLGLAIALYMGWSPGMIILFYWAENIIIGLWQIPRLWAVSNARAGERVVLGLFFTVHYGLFAIIHGVFVGALFFSPESIDTQSLSLPTMEDTPLKPFYLALILPGLPLALLGLFISHGAQFFQDWSSGRLAQAKIQRVMFEPYPRLVVLHVTIIGSGLVFNSALPWPTFGVILLGIVKTVMDFRNEHKTAAKREPTHVS